MSAVAWSTADEEQAVFARARSGDREAFTQLVERHHQELVRICYAVTGDVEAARDAAQLAWLKAWQRLPSVRQPERLRAWLIAIAANEARQSVRSRRRRAVREIAVVGDERDGQLDRAAGSTERSVRSADSFDLGAALARLDPDERQLLAMRYLAGLTADEIGAAMGRPASTVRSRLSRLTQRLREELDND